MTPAQYNLPFVLDSDCIIKLAREGTLQHLLAEDDVVIIPFKVDEEIRKSRSARNPAKIWIQRNHHLIKRFQTSEEHSLYFELISKNSRILGEGECAGIALAKRRNGTFVSDDRQARRAALNYAVTAITPWEFRDFILKRLPE